jgi:hypothetical protein
MDKKELGAYLTNCLGKYNFRSYGPKLFYLELPDSIIVLTQTNYNTAAELYMDIIIKECHPEITKVTKSILKDKMLLDVYARPKLFYRSENTKKVWDFDFYEIPEREFEEKIDEIYNDYIKEFHNGAVNGIRKYNAFWNENRNFTIELFSDSAMKIGQPDLAGEKGHDWFLSDRYLLLFEYDVDVRFVNKRTERYIMENVISNIPKDLKGKAIAKWCNEQCKEIFLVKGKRFAFGYGVTFPFVDGKPLKYYGCETKPGEKTKQFYLNEHTNERFYLIITEVDKNDRDNSKYELVKIT